MRRCVLRARALRVSRADASYEKRLLRFTTPDVLIIDDLGLRGLNPDESGDLYEVVRRRYEQGSTLITSNRAIDLRSAEADAIGCHGMVGASFALGS